MKICMKNGKKAVNPKLFLFWTLIVMYNTLTGQKGITATGTEKRTWNPFQEQILKQKILSSV